MNKIKTLSFIVIIMMCLCTSCFASNSNQIKNIEKEYTIPIENISNYKIDNEIIIDKVTYKLVDVKKEENKQILTKDKEIMEELIVTTNDEDIVLNLFEATKRIEEDGYAGSIELQNDSLEIKVNESYQEQYKASIDKEYNNISSNDLNNIPKQIEEKGITYYLTKPEWNVATTVKIQGKDIPNSYNGIMHYEAVKTRTVVKNYKAKVLYKGALKKEEIKSITYKLNYEEVKQETNYVITIATVSGIIIFSGIVILRRKNVKVYNYTSSGNMRLVKKEFINRKNPIIDITVLKLTSSKFKIVLLNSIYEQLKNQNITIKYFDKKFVYCIEEKEFEISI